ncbi:unnamed protein product [Heterobilharzia americana]|nr:unnamed protein product [Heterobilharzia americana]
MIKINYQENYIKMMYKIRENFNFIDKPLFYTCLGEFLGTFILMTIGLGIMIQNVVQRCKNDHLDNHNNNRYLTISTGWSIAFILSQMISSILSYGLMNPAMTLSFALIGKLSYHYVLPLTVVQLIGSFFSTLILFIIYYENIFNNFSQSNNQLNSTIIELFILVPSASHYICFFDRFILTMITTVFILSLNDDRNYDMHKIYRSIYMAIFTAGRIGALSMNAGTSINPIRDLGPRLAIAVCGWGISVFKTHNYYFWIPIVAPYLGSILGTLLHELIVRTRLSEKHEEDFQSTVNLSS